MLVGIKDADNLRSKIVTREQNYYFHNEIFNCTILLGSSLRGIKKKLMNIHTSQSPLLRFAFTRVTIATT